MSLPAEEIPVAPELAPVDPAKPSRRGVWFLRGALAIGCALIILGVALAVVRLAIPSALGLQAHLAVLSIPAVIIGAGGVCVGIGGFLFGWGGGAPLLPIGSHQSVIATTVLAMVVASLIAVGYLVMLPAGSSSMANVFGVAAVSFYGTLLAMVYLQGVRTGLVTRETLGLTRSQVLNGLAVGSAGAAIILVLAAANGLVLQSLGVSQPQEESFRWLQGRPPDQYVMAVFAVVILAPTVEELFFRGYVFNAYLSHKGPMTAYLTTSVIFSLVHALPSLFIAIFGTALVLSYIYRRSGTIVAPILAHILNNAVAFVTLVAGSQQ
ncbi:MAG TPA: type II CAAX endopeptidase family protein [Chloroflexota bacterium]|nr:type II CAAX endopeptidase family protein [Chloroflexota bacterium]